MKILSVDVGTSGVRAGIYDEELKCLSTHSVRTKLYRKNGGIVETDPDEIFNNFVKVSSLTISEVKEKVGISDLTLLSFSLQGEAFVCVDKNNVPKCFSPVSMDERGKEFAEKLSFNFSSDEYRDITGQPLHPMFSAFKIASDARFHNMVEGEFFLPLDAYISVKLGASAYADITSAARFGLLNVDKTQWDERLCKIFGVDLSNLPPLVMPGQFVGEVSDDWKVKLGVSSALKIMAGAHDQACAFWGSGGNTKGVATYSLGTTDCFTQGSVTRKVLPKNSGLATYKCFENLWVTLAGTAASGWSLEWLDKILNNDIGVSVKQMVKDFSDNPTDLLVLPYLAGSGTIDNDPNMRGVILGVSLETDRRDIVRAFLEASGYEVAKIVASTANVFESIRDIHAVGGGVADKKVMQLRANACNFPLKCLGYDAALRGAAIQALVGEGIFADYSKAPAFESISSVTPCAEYVEHYEKQRKKYVCAYNALKSL